MDLVAEVQAWLQTIQTNNIHFKEHFLMRTRERPITKELIITYIRQPSKLLKVEEQASRNTSERKVKLWFRMSATYTLIIIAVKKNKDLYILTAWNTNRKWKKKS